MTIESYGPVDGAALIGTLEHGFFDDISLGADFYTGHVVVVQADGRQATDLSEPEYTVSRQDSAVEVTSSVHNGSIMFQRYLRFNNACLAIEQTVELQQRNYFSVRAGHITFVPDGWDAASLFVETHNGGAVPERFPLGDRPIDYNRSVSHFVSAEHGLGATEGWVRIGDARRSIKIEHDLKAAALIPRIIFVPTSNATFFLRIQYSAAEHDDTTVRNNAPHSITMRWLISPE